jgi:4-diphosphocytidyl-2-C-methyl-D-erythritol kinase
MKAGEALRDTDICNAFERTAYETFEGLGTYRSALVEAGAAKVHLSGSGPTLFSVLQSRQEAEEIASRLAGEGARVYVARTLGAEEATRVVVE